MAARVVDLPLPVGPVTRTSPFGAWPNFRASGQTQLFHRENLARDLAKDAADPIFLHEEIGAIAGQPRQLIREVDIPRFFELLCLLLRADLEEHGLQFIVLEDLNFTRSRSHEL